MPHLTTLWKIIVLSFIINYFIVTATPVINEKIESTTLNDNIAMESSIENEMVPNFLLPKPIFNEGKPFFVEKDPVSGKLDFNSKKSAGIENFVKNSNDDENKGKLSDIRSPNEISPNFHDFLNLPVKYSSSKSVYPLVSSSYANLKYQGNNKNYVSNHKNYTTSTTTSPKYYTSHAKYPFATKGPVTKLLPSTSMKIFPTASATTSSSKIITTTTKPLFTKPTIKSTTRTKFEETIPTKTTKKIFTTSSSITTTTELPKITKPTLPKATQNKSSEEQPIGFQKTTSTVETTTIPKIVKTTTTPLTTLLPSSSTVKIQSSPPPPPPPTFQPLPPNRVPSLAIANVPPHGFQSSGEIFNNQNNQDKNSVSLADLFNSIAEDESSESNAIHFETSSEKNVPQHRPLAPSVYPPNPYNNFNQSPVRPSLQPVIKNEDNFHNQYVKYEVQQPNLNVMPYKPVSSMNNIIISPDQNSATFVLGSQQSVGGAGHYIGSAVKEQVFTGQQNSGGPQRPPFEGQVFNEPNFQLGSSKPQGFTTMASVQIQPHEYKNTNVRFPTEKDLQEAAFENAPVITGTYNNDITIPNGHSAPIALPQSQIVVFPPDEKIAVETLNAELDSKEVGTKIVFASDEKTGNSPNFQNLPPLRDSQPDYRQPPLSENLTPPFEAGLRRPPPLHQEGSQRLPQLRPAGGFNRPHPPSYLYNEQPGRKPLPQQHRPLVDRTLPNILPQFRPNAKISHGHPYNKDVGVQRIQLNQNGRRPLHQSEYNVNPNSRISGPPPAPFPIRRTPLPNRFNSKMAPAPSGLPPPLPISDMKEPNRRIYRLPPSPAQLQPQIPGPDRLYAQSLPPRRYIDGYPVAQRPNQGPNGQPPIIHHDLKADLPPPPYVEEDLYKQPPRSKIMENANLDRPKLEPVVTLQMMQTKKLLQAPSTNIVENVSAGINVNGQPQPGYKLSGDKNPVYVVYPVKSSPLKLDVITPSDNDDPVVIGHRGDQLPLPPSEINTMSSGNDYQNTPFAVIRQEQEPILMAKQRPHYQLQLKPGKSNFPYHLEQPDPIAATELDNKSHIRKGQLNEYHSPEHLYNIGEEPINARIVNKLNFGAIGDNNDNYAISSTLTRITEKPIAIAYTPTEPNYYGRPPLPGDKYSLPNYGNAVISEIRDRETQTEAGPINREESEYLIRGEHYEQDFQAPFYPSIHLGAVTDTYQGWSIVGTSPKPPQHYQHQQQQQQHPQQQQYQQQQQQQQQQQHQHQQQSHQENKIDRSDTDVDETDIDSVEAVTKKFDIDNFQPEYLSGFKPIYPSGSNNQTNVQTPSSTVAPAPAPTITTIATTHAPAVSSSKEEIKEKPKPASSPSFLDVLFGTDDDYEEIEEENTTASSS